MRTIKYISNEQIKDLTNRYINAGGEVVEIVPGTLGYGTTLLLNNGQNLKG